MEMLQKKYCDTFTIAGRCLLLSKRNPDTLLTSIILPVLMMLLFVSLFGNLIQAGNTSYVNYIVPGVLLQCFGQCSSVTAISVNRDVTGGMASRFCTLPIKQTSVLYGYALEAVIRNLFTSAAVLISALFLGFRPEAGFSGWCVVFLLLLGSISAFSWLSIAVGIAANSSEGAGGLLTFAIVLPYLSSGFVPLETMPKALELFARYQPMTPVINTLRELLLGNPLQMNTFTAAFFWCIGLTVLFYFISMRLLENRLKS